MIALEKVPAGYGAYTGIHDVINKRESFTTALMAYHDMPTDPSFKSFDITSRLDSLVREAKELKDTDDVLKQTLKLYDRMIRPLAVKIDSQLVPHVICHNDLSLNTVFHNGSGDVVATSGILRKNDYAWDYATLLARGSDSRTYVSILNMNHLVIDAGNKYKDPKLQIRILICMILADFMDGLHMYLAESKEEYKEHISNFSTETHTKQLVLNRVFSLIVQSYTTIDYFNYVYHK